MAEEALENAARAHFALKKLLADENGDAVAMKSSSIIVSALRWIHGNRRLSAVNSSS